MTTDDRFAARQPCHLWPTRGRSARMQADTTQRHSEIFAGPNSTQPTFLTARPNPTFSEQTIPDPNQTKQQIHCDIIEHFYVDNIPVTQGTQCILISSHTEVTISLKVPQISHSQPKSGSNPTKPTRWLEFVTQPDPIQPNPSMDPTWVHFWHCWLGGRKGIRPVKNWVVGFWRGYLSGVRCKLAYGPADTTATHCLLLHLNPDWFCLLVPAHPGSPG